MTDQEIKVMGQIIDLWNEYQKLPVINQDDTTDFRWYIHRMQEMIGSRQVLLNFSL